MRCSHRAAAPEGKGISGEAELLEAGHRYKLGRFQARQTILPDVEPFETSQFLKDRRLDRRDEIVRQIQLLQRRQIDEPLISHRRDAIVRQTELLQHSQTVECMAGNFLDAAVVHFQRDQVLIVFQERPIENIFYPRFENQDVAHDRLAETYGDI